MTSKTVHYAAPNGDIRQLISLRDMGAGAGGRRSIGHFVTRRGVRRQRRVWSRRAQHWDHHAPTGLEKVTDTVLAAVDVRPGDEIVDLGCGTGTLSLPLAERGARLLAVDVSPAMIARLKERAAERSLRWLDGLAMPIEDLRLPAGSADLIVTSYALHHLRDQDKAALVGAAYHWLRPGGTLVVADMMFGRGATKADRVIIRSKIRALARKGIGGWWRIAKNGYRYLARVQERPVSVSAWTAMFGRAGFVSITASSVVAEAGLVIGHRPLPAQAEARVPAPARRASF